MELTDDTVAKRAILFDTSSSSSSSHEIAPNLHESSGEIGDPQTRESVMEKSRVDADMEISAIEALTNAKLEVDQGKQDVASLAVRLRQSPKPQNSTASETRESTLRCTDAKIISGKWVLQHHKARTVLRGFEEDVKDEDVFASTTMTASVRLLLS